MAFTSSVTKRQPPYISVSVSVRRHPVPPHCYIYIYVCVTYNNAHSAERRGRGTGVTRTAIGRGSLAMTSHHITDPAWVASVPGDDVAQSGSLSCFGSVTLCRRGQRQSVKGGGIHVREYSIIYVKYQSCMFYTLLPKHTCRYY